MAEKGCFLRIRDRPGAMTRRVGWSEGSPKKLPYGAAPKDDLENPNTPVALHLR